MIKYTNVMYKNIPMYILTPVQPYTSPSLNFSQCIDSQHMYQDNYTFKLPNKIFSITRLHYLKFLSHSTTYCLLWLSLFQFIFIFICNPSISNPGPDSPYKHKFSSTLSVFYQNIQGLIPFGNLAENHPVLDNNKLFELHTYIYNHSPDIIILNETWLKASILDSEILPPNKYKIFRLDRSEKTHPIDPLNTNKYRRNGGGVLIAINASLQMESKVIHTNCSAELLAIELILPNKTKIIVTTCYRVGTLGISNCSEILNTLDKLSRKKCSENLLLLAIST